MATLSEKLQATLSKALSAVRSKAFPAAQSTRAQLPFSLPIRPSSNVAPQVSIGRPSDSRLPTNQTEQQKLDSLFQRVDEIQHRPRPVTPLDLRERTFGVSPLVKQVQPTGEPASIGERGAQPATTAILTSPEVSRRLNEALPDNEKQELLRYWAPQAREQRAEEEAEKISLAFGSMRDSPIGNAAKFITSATESISDALNSRLPTSARVRSGFEGLAQSVMNAVRIWNPAVGAFSTVRPSLQKKIEIKPTDELFTKIVKRSADLALLMPEFIAAGKVIPAGAGAELPIVGSKIAQGFISKFMSPLVSMGLVSGGRDIAQTAEFAGALGAGDVALSYLPYGKYFHPLMTAIVGGGLAKLGGASNEDAIAEGLALGAFSVSRYLDPKQRKLLLKNADLTPEETMRRIEAIKKHIPEEILSTKGFVKLPIKDTKVDRKALDKRFIEEPQAEKRAVIIDPDAIKKELPNYDPKDTDPIHLESTKIADALFTKALKSDKSGKVKFTAGGSGSGKTEVVIARIKNEPSIIFDGTGENIKKMRKKINEAIAAGKDVEIIPTYTDLVEAYAFNSKRPRRVSDEVFFKKHFGFRDTMVELAKEYGEDIKMRAIINSTKHEPMEIKFESPAQRLEFLEKMRYNENDVARIKAKIAGKKAKGDFGDDRADLARVDEIEGAPARRDGRVPIVEEPSAREQRVDQVPPSPKPEPALPTEISRAKPSLEERLPALEARVKKFAEELAPADKTKFQEFTTKIKNKEIALRAQEVVQDSWIRVKRLAEREGIKLTDESNPYLAETLFHGRAAERLGDAEAVIAKLDADLVKKAKELKLPDEKFRTMMSDFMLARHAPERNKAMKKDGAAGMTNAEAKEITERIEADPHAAEVKEFANRLQEINDKTLDILKEGELIGDELFNTLRERYKNHVPLQRVLETDVDFVDALTGKGFGVRGAGIKAAKGSEKEVKDIWGNILANYKEAITRSEKNRVNLNTLKFYRENKEILGDVFEVVQPKFIGKTTEGKPILQPITDPSVLPLREQGKTVYLKIKDPKISQAIQGLNTEQLPALIRFIGTVTRFYSGMATRFNPEFAFSNIARDAQDLIVNMSADLGAKKSAGAIAKVPQSMKHVFDYVAGRDTEGARLYKQLRLDGGTTGGLGASTRQQVDIDVTELMKTNRSKPRKVFKAAIDAVDKWNSIFEDATRLSAYREALDAGKTRPQAADIAKNATVNFNKKGVSGSVVNALYMFSNASIQGAARTIRSMSNPKVAAAVSAVVGSAVWATRSWNDAVDPDWREKVTDWEENANLVIVLPPKDDGTFRSLKLPVAWGIRPVKIMADRVYDNSTGEGEGVAKATLDVVVSAWEAYNPVGSGDFVQSITPSILDMPVDISRNRAWHGGMIRPEWMEGLPKSEQVFSGTAETTKGRASIGASQFMKSIGLEASPEDLKYVFDQIIGGAGRAATRAAETVAQPFVDADLLPKDTFVLNRFYMEKRPDQIERMVDRSKQDEFIESLGKVEPEERADLMRDYVLEKGGEEARSMLFKLRDRGFDTTGVSTSFSSFSDGSIELYEKYKGLETDQKKNFISDMSDNSKKGLAKIINADRNPDAIQNADGTFMTTQQYFAHQRKVKILGGESIDDIPASMPKGWRASKELDRKMKRGRSADARKERAEEAAETRKARADKRAGITEEPKVEEPKEEKKEEIQTKAKKAKSAKSMADVAKLYVKAFRVDPFTAIKTLFTREQLKSVRGDAVIMVRMGISESQAVKRKGGAGETDKLDHTVPLGMGGSNSESNLKIVTNDEWRSYTPMENYLIKLLEAGKIKEKLAAKIIKSFKNGDLTPEEIREKYPLK